MGDFTDEEQATLGQVFNGVAHAECFDYSFMEGCTDYMDNMMDEMAGMMTETITSAWALFNLFYTIYVLLVNLELSFRLFVS